MRVSMNGWLAVASAAALVFGAADRCNAGATAFEPTVEAAGAKPDDREAATPAARSQTQCTEAQCCVVNTEGAKKFCYAGAGLVVDDKTGKPVELFAYQEGLPNSKYPSGTMWICTYGAHRRRGGQFSISHNIVRGEKVRVRVLAYGYLPEVVIAETDKDGRLLENPLVVRIRRGREISGRVLDHQGKPIVGAKVFLQGKGRLVALQHRIRRLGVETVSTDSDGRFVAAGGGEPVTHVIVYAPHLNVWAVPIPENLGEPEDGGPEELTIRLPQPATLKVFFDIPGAVDEHEVHVQEPGGLLVPAGGKAQLQLNLKKLHGEGWRGTVDACQMAAVANPGEVVIDNLAPGVYDFCRLINLETRGGRGVRCSSSGHREITLRPGETQVVRFVRDKGKRTTGGKEMLEKLKSLDAIYAAAFTASGNRPGWPKKKWKLTMLDGETVYEEQVVEVPEPAESRIGRFIPFRRTLYVGPKLQAEHDWVGRIRRYGPLDPWPEDSPGPATSNLLTVVRPDALTYKLLINRPLLCLGRGYSKYITDIKEVVKQEDGRLKIAADGIDITSSAEAAWELVVDPEAAYMVCSARVVDNKGRAASISNSGLKKYDARCVPEKAECRGAFINASFEIQSASPEADVELLRRTKAAMRPPYLAFTDIRDRRVKPTLHMSYEAGKLSSKSRKKDWDVGLEDTAQPDTTAQPTDEATGDTPDGQAPPVRPVSDAEPDGKEILDKLTSIDAVYAAAFTASGRRLGWPGRKWKFAMLRGRIALEEEVVEIPEHSGPAQVGRFIAFRSTWYVGPTVQATYDWVGRIPHYGPLDPWPENSPGPATTGSLKVDDPDAPTYTLHIQRTLSCLGRGYSKYITKIRDVSPQEDGRLKVTADGLAGDLYPGAKWELVIEPDAEYMVRSAVVVDSGNRRRSFTNSGLRRYGSHCVPEKGECKGGLISGSFEFQSASFEADVEFLERAKATMQPPYLIHTDVSDQRRTPELRIQYDAGKTLPQGGKPGFDLDWEKEAVFDMRRRSPFPSRSCGPS